jgi:hypothetical protein
LINDPAVADYLTGLEPEPDPLLAEMRAHGERDHIPIVEHVTGGLLETLAAATGAKRAVEVGTAIGVSTLHLSRGGAHVTSFEIDPERHAAAKEYLRRGGFEPDLGSRAPPKGSPSSSRAASTSASSTGRSPATGRTWTRSFPSCAPAGSCSSTTC